MGAWVRLRRLRGGWDWSTVVNQAGRWYLLTSTGGRGNKQSDETTNRKYINSTPWAESNPQPPCPEAAEGLSLDSIPQQRLWSAIQANTGANIMLLFSRKRPFLKKIIQLTSLTLRFICAKISRVLSGQKLHLNVHWCRLISSVVF